MSGDSNEAKRALRAEMRRRAAGVSPDQTRAWSQSVCDTVRKSPRYARARTILVYLSLPGEVDLSELVVTARTDGKRLGAPRIDWDCREMAAAVLPAEEGLLRTTLHGLREPGPEAEEIPVGELDLVLVPGLGFDDRGARLGRGAGYYDRFLARRELRADVVGVAFEVQLAPRVPVEPHDIRVRAIATERRMIEITE